MRVLYGWRLRPQIHRNACAASAPRPFGTESGMVQRQKPYFFNNQQGGFRLYKGRAIHQTPRLSEGKDHQPTPVQTGFGRQLHGYYLKVLEMLGESFAAWETNAAPPVVWERHFYATAFALLYNKRSPCHNGAGKASPLSPWCKAATLRVPSSLSAHFRVRTALKKQKMYR